MKFRRQETADEGVNLTPLIDVVFLLLIFFMVSTTFTKETHLEIDLPEASGKAMAKNDVQIEVLVDSQGNYSVNGQLLVNKQLDTLEAAITKLSGGEVTMPFLITGDSNASYQSIVSVMDLAGRLGFVNLNMTTQAPAGNENE